MQFLGVQNLQIGAKGQRGLAYDPVASAALTASRIGVEGLIFQFGEEIKAGQPTKMSVKLGAPGSANIKAITASLRVTAGPDSSEPIGVGVGVTSKEHSDQDQTLTLAVTVDPPSGLQNVEVKLAGGQSIWSKAGPAPTGEYAIPDFTKQANAYLDSLPPSTAEATLDFLVTSEIDGRASIRLGPVDWSIMQTQAFKNDLDSTVKLDRSLELGFGEVATLELDPISVPAGKHLRRQSLTMDLGGQFGPERLLGRIDAHDGADFVLVSAANSAAQSLRLESAAVKAPLSCSGLAIFLVPTAADAPPAELYAELQPDQGGQPASGPPLAKASFKLTPPGEGQSLAWTCATFEAPVQLALDTSYWAVLKGVSNGVQLALRGASPPAGEALTCAGASVNRGGQTWRPLLARRPGQGPPQALLALMYTPGIETNAAAVEIAVEGAPDALRVDPAGAVRTVSPAVPADQRPALRVQARAYAKGALTLANVIQEYRLE
jgi:hypothetical protein